MLKAEFTKPSYLHNSYRSDIRLIPRKVAFKIKVSWIRRNQIKFVAQPKIADRTLPVQNYAERASWLRKLIIELCIILMVSLGIVVFIMQLLRPEIVLDPIKIPENLTKLGYTEVVVAERLADAAKEIQRSASNLAYLNSWRREARSRQEIEMSAYLQDISVPGVPFTMRTISRFIRQELGLPSVRIRGEITYESNQLVLMLRNSSSAGVPSVRISHKDVEVEELLQKGGEGLVKLVAPSILAIIGFHMLSRSTNQAEDSDQLIRLYEYCLSNPPASDDPLIYTLWGATLFSRNRPEEAKKKMEEALLLNPKFTYALNGMGIILRRLNRPEEALKKIEEAIALDPKYAPAYMNWGDTLQEMNRNEEALKKYEKALELDPKYSIAYIGWGIALQNLNRNEEALEKYEKAVEIDPNHVYSYNNWGDALLNLGRYEEALEKYEKAVEIDPSNAYSYNQWGNALIRLGRYEEASEKFRMATDLTNK